jgi:cation diffusion facilitator family transporter
MHTHSISDWQHVHVFLGENHARNERRTWFVVALTAAMMAAEIVAGAAFGSMALLADGFHMATHAGALTIAGVAYLYSRRHAHDRRFAFGTGKLGDLAGFTSAIVLALVAVLIGYESILRLWTPVAIRFDEAILVAVLGLIVNLASAWLLRDGDHHARGHQDHDRHHEHHPDLGAHADAHHHDHDRRDHNLRSAYFHVLADTLTSVLAIVGLIAGRTFGWIWMDPLVGVVGAAVIAHWSWGLLRDTGAILLDTVPDDGFAEGIRKRLEQGTDRVSDLHLWRIGPGHIAAIISLVCDRPQPPDHYKARLSDMPQLSHVTVEVLPCGHHHGAA